MKQRSPHVAVVLAAFLLSGFTSLVLQVAWSKALGLKLGSTLEAVSTVVAVYLGGLALGAWLAGRMAQRLARPLAAYGLLEIGVGAYAFVSLELLSALDPLIGVAYARLGAESAAYGLSRAVVSGAVLLPPTLLMGATLPWLVAWRGRDGAFERELAWLYGVNTFGAVAGVVAAGFGLIPGLGVAATTRLVGALAIVLGIVLFLLGRREAPRVIQRGREDVVVTTRPQRVVALLFALSGAAALTLEMVWTRIFSLVFGSTVYSFSLVLAAYLCGIAAGSMLLGGRLASASRPWRAFASLQVAVAAGVALGLWWLPRLPELSMTLLITGRERLPLVYLGQGMLAALVVLIPCLALGALFPVATRLVRGASPDGARATGLAYAANTAGTLTGTLLSGFVLLPVVGVHATLLGTVVVTLALALVGWFADPLRERTERFPVPIVAMVAAVAVLTAIAPRWDRALFTLGVYRYPGAAASGQSARAAAEAEIRRVLDEDELLFYREGRHSVVSVHTYRGREEKRTLRVNGKPDAGTGEDMATQVMLGHLPMLWAPTGSPVLVIGFGSGVTARAALAWGPERVTIAEIEPAVIEAGPFFEEVNLDVLADPQVELRLEDAREHLLHSGRRYGMIVSEPSNPWIAGVNNLFTTDFYERVRAALLPGGVFCQWVQFYALSQQAMASLLSTFAEVFPEGEAFLFHRDLLLIGPPPGKVAGDRLLLEPRSLDPAAAYAARFGLHDNGYVAAHHAGRVAWIAGQLPATPLNTDDRPYVEHRAPLDLYRIGEDERMLGEQELRETDTLAALERWVEAADLVAVATAAGVTMARIGETERAVSLAAALEARGAAAAAAAVRQATSRSRLDAATAADLAHAAAALEAERLDDVDALLDAILAVNPEGAAANLLAGRTEMRRNRVEPALMHLRRVLENGDVAQRAAAHNNLGILAMRLGRVDAGRAAFEAARATHPGHVDSYLNLDRLYSQLQQPDAARDVLEDGLRRAYPAEALVQALGRRKP